MKSRYYVEKPKGFYDLDQIKNIPILDVCSEFNIPVEKRGNNFWCKARSERTASTILHPDNNKFHDFGSNTGGDVISFVSYVCNVEPSAAISMLGERFHVPQLNLHEGKNENYVSDWEYARIGLYADRATKNFTWDFDNMPVERMHEIEEKYSVPMIILRIKHPKIYEQILRQKALPYLYQLRNEYYLDIKSDYQLVCELGNSDAFNPEKYSKQIKDLITAEKIFVRASVGTSITFSPQLDYEPKNDLTKLQTGLIKPGLGNTTKKKLEGMASAVKTQIRYRTMDYTAYMASDIDQYNHTAFLKGDVVVVGFLASDYSKFRSYFEKKTQQTKNGLDEQINAAIKNKSFASSQNLQKTGKLER